jgi:aldehyde dehydrogenase (NAD+)
MSENDDVKALDRLRSYFMSGATRSLRWRECQLEALQTMLDEHEDDFCHALWNDLRKNRVESYITEIQFVAKEIRHAKLHLQSWLRPKPIVTPLVLGLGKAQVRFDPLGLCLIIGAWNFPLLLLLSPLVPAICGGNCAILKPSELAPSTAETIARLIPKYLDTNGFSVITGGPAEASQLLEQKLDHIFFTGSSAVGSFVMEKAAKTLTPLVLELGGKNPTIVHESADLRVAARRIIQGKFINTGQTCTAPDYLLVWKSVKDSLLAHMKEAIVEFYGANPQTSPDYGRIVNVQHYDRLIFLLQSGSVYHGGESNKNELFLSPTILENVGRDSPIMQEEVFGPILPVLEVEAVEEVTEIVNSKPFPLALYLFSGDREVAEGILEKTRSGGASVNDCAVHPLVRELPFGGVGCSGIGKYHGEWGFRVYTNARGVFYNTTSVDPNFRYPPYSNHSWLRKLMFYLS